MSWTVSTSVNHSQSGNSEWRHNTARLELMKFYKNAGRVDKNVTFVDNNRFMLIETVISIAVVLYCWWQHNYNKIFIFINMSSLPSTFEFLSTKILASHMSDRHKYPFLVCVFCSASRENSMTITIVIIFAIFIIFINMSSISINIWVFINRNTGKSH